MSEVLAQLEKKGGGNEIEHYVTGHDAPSSHSTTVDITKYKNMIFILTQGANNRSYLRAVGNLTVAEFASRGYTYSLSVTGISATVNYSNGTFTFPASTNGGSGITVVLY